MPHSNDDNEVLTAAELLRRKKMTGASKKTEEEARKPEKTGADIDDEIARLEAELAQDDSDSKESSSSEDESVNDSSEASRSAPAEKNMGKGVVSMSAVKDERIQGLPEELLPKVPPKRKSNQKMDKRAKKRKEETKPNSGLEMAVKEVLSGYLARSSEKLPFYCRVCQKQYNNESDFFVHRETDFHKAAVEAERRASYCKLCRKQLTSPAQMKEHLKSKPHKDRLHFMASKQHQQQSRGNNRNYSKRGGGRDGRSSRQWV